MDLFDPRSAWGWQGHLLAIYTSSSERDRWLAGLVSDAERSGAVVGGVGGRRGHGARLSHLPARDWLAPTEFWEALTGPPDRHGARRLRDLISESSTGDIRLVCESAEPLDGLGGKTCKELEARAAPHPGPALDARSDRHPSGAVEQAPTVSLLCLCPRLSALTKHELNEHVGQHPDGLVVRDFATRRDRNCLCLRGAVDTFNHDVFAAAVGATTRGADDGTSTAGQQDTRAAETRGDEPGDARCDIDLDMSEVEYLAGRGASTLLERINDHRRAGGTVTISGHRWHVARVLERHGAVPVHKSHDTVLQFGPL